MVVFSDPQVTTDANGRWIILNSDVSKPRVEAPQPVLPPGSYVPTGFEDWFRHSPPPAPEPQRPFKKP